MDSKPISHITAGLLIAAFLVVVALVFQFSGMATNASGLLIQIVFIILGLIFFINKWGKVHNHNQTFGNLFAYGFKTTTVYTLINVTFVIVLFLLFPDLKEKTLEASRIQLENDPRLSDDQIDEYVDLSRRMFWVSAIGGTTFMLVVIGAIGSLIGAAVTKKHPNHPFDQVNP